MTSAYRTGSWGYYSLALVVRSEPGTYFHCEAKLPLNFLMRKDSCRNSNNIKYTCNNVHEAEIIAIDEDAGTRLMTISLISNTYTFIQQVSLFNPRGQPLNVAFCEANFSYQVVQIITSASALYFWHCTPKLLYLHQYLACCTLTMMVTFLRTTQSSKIMDPWIMKC